MEETKQPQIESEEELEFDDLEDYLEEDFEDDDMSLRDHFAGLALQAILKANDDSLEDTEEVRGAAGEWAKRAYLIADAMIDAKYGIDEFEAEEESSEESE